VTVLHEALVRACPDGALPEGTAFRALTDPQQHLVRALDESPATWRPGDHPGLFGNLTSLLAQHHLPDDPDALPAYIQAS
jgi:hypothetical protein